MSTDPQTRYNQRPAKGLCSELPSMVRADPSVVTNINDIVSRYQKTGILTSLARSVPEYGDFSAAEDLHTAMNLVLDAEETFGLLPSAVRAAAGNDPITFLNMLATKDGTQTLLEAGLDGPPPRSDGSPQVEPFPSSQPRPEGAPAERSEDASGPSSPDAAS